MREREGTKRPEVPNVQILENTKASYFNTLPWRCIFSTRIDEAGVRYTTAPLSRCLIDPAVHYSEYQGLVRSLLSNIDELVRSSDFRRSNCEVFDLANIGYLYLHPHLSVRYNIPPKTLPHLATLQILVRIAPRITKTQWIPLHRPNRLPYIKDRYMPRLQMFVPRIIGPHVVFVFVQPTRGRFINVHPSHRTIDVNSTLAVLCECILEGPGPNVMLILKGIFRASLALE